MNETIVFAGYRFPSNKACLVCEHVFDKARDIEIIVHDFDGWIQCLCGDTNHLPNQSRTIALSEIIDRLPTSEQLKALMPGYYAIKGINDSWKPIKIEDG